MMELKFWLSEQGLTVRELAAQLGVPVKTVQDWVYRGVQEKLAELMKCTQHWVIEAANGHTSRGICQLCNEVREFENSIEKSLGVSTTKVDRA